MPADRLAELLRQRALLQEHLAWLEREIAASKPLVRDVPVTMPLAEPVPGVPVPAPLPARIPVVAPIAVPTASPAPAPEVDAMLDEYRVRPDVLKKDIRHGCLLYFVAAMALLGLGVLGLYYALRSD